MLHSGHNHTNQSHQFQSSACPVTCYHPPWAAEWEWPLLYNKKLNDNFYSTGWQAVMVECSIRRGDSRDSGERQVVRLPTWHVAMALCPTAAVAVLFYVLHCDANVNRPDCCGRGYCVVLHWTMCWRFLHLYNVHIIRHDDYDRVVTHSDYYCCIVCTVVVTGREPYIFRKHSSRSICASLLICSCVKPFIISFTVQCTQKKKQNCIIFIRTTGAVVRTDSERLISVKLPSQAPFAQLIFNCFRNRATPWSPIGQKSPTFLYPLYYTPFGGDQSVFCEYVNIRKTEMTCLPNGEKRLWWYM